jgi:hypothetical protein
MTLLPPCRQFKGILHHESLGLLWSATRRGAAHTPTGDRRNKQFCVPRQSEAVARQYPPAKTVDVAVAARHSTGDARRLRAMSSKS